MSQSSKDDEQQTKTSAHRVTSIAATCFFHGFASIVLTAFVSLPTIDWTRVQMLWESYAVYGFEPNWLRLALHLGLGACLWAIIVIAYMLVKQRRDESRSLTRVVKKARGTVMMEFLIILVPMLLMTSGLAQLAMLNVTAVLADLAVFNAARTVFVWAPEVNQPRYESNHGQIQIRDRARTIASMALAPTAPSDYYLGRSVTPGSSNYYRRQRAIVVGAFMPDTTPSSFNYEWSGGQTALTGGGAFDLDVDPGGPVGETVTYALAFDTTGFKWRAARKMTQAEWGLYHEFDTICPTACDEVNGSESGVHFTYWYNIVFPWFGYLWGDFETVGQRTGWYAKIERRHTFPAQPMP